MASATPADETSAPVGMAFAPLNQDEQQQLGLDPSVKGVVVAQVTPGSRADESGVQSGDVIVRVGNQAVTSPSEAVGENPRRANTTRRRRCRCWSCGTARPIISRCNWARHEVRRAASGGQPPRPAPAINMKILLVEDNERVAGFLLKGLREQGHTVDHADNGRDGLFLATSETYDAIILDRVLPGGVEGLAIVEALRKTGNKTPILILSALGEVDDRIRGLRAGGDDYLAKPFALANWWRGWTHWSAARESAGPSRVWRSAICAWTRCRTP